MDLVWQDIRHGFRSFRSGPGLIAIAVLSLGLGIGANATIFSAVDVFMFRPLPFPDSDRLHTIYTTNDARGWTQMDGSIPDFVDYRAQSRTMEITAIRGKSLNLAGTGDPERLAGSQVSANFFRAIGVQPILGRGFVDEEEHPGNGHVVVLADGVWQRRFGGDPSIIGTTLLLDGEQYSVVGIMPPKFWFDDNNEEVWTPLTIFGQEPRNQHELEVYGRVRDGSTIADARRELSTMAQQLSDAYPETSVGNSARMISLHEDIFDSDFRMGTLIATVAVAFVLLIACANVANLLLTRAVDRSREVALRGALGASRSRIVRQFLTEALILSGLGGVLGVALSVAGIRGLVALMPSWFPRVDEISLDGRVLLFCAAVSVMTGIVFGLAPAMQGSKVNLTDSLKEGGRTGTSSRGGQLRRTLVVAEVSLALVLLVSSALLVQGFAKIRLVDLGFDGTDVLTLRLTLTEAEYPDSAAVIEYWRDFQTRASALPGVVAVGATTILPWRGNTGTYYSLPGEQSPDGQRAVTGYRAIVPGYFDAMDIPLLRGRHLADQDLPGTPRVIVVNEAFAERHWPDDDPVGQQIVFSSGAVEIVGVVRNALDQSAQADAEPTVYVSALQRGSRSMSWVIESTRDPDAIVSAVRAEVRAMDANLPAANLRPMQALLDETIGGDTIMAKVMAVLAGIALVLAVGGVYGVMAYTVSQRQQELGIRMALGARTNDVVTLVVRQGTTLALLGIGIGLVLGAAVTRSLSAFLYGVSPFDPLTFGGVSLALLAAGLTASYLPARRATRVDPVTALRSE